MPHFSKNFIKPRIYIDPNTLDHIFSKDRVRWINIDSQFNKIFTEMRHGKSLWKIFLIAALVFLLIETLISAPNTKNMKTKAID